MGEYEQIKVPYLSAPEFRKQCPRRDLMFNVGFHENSSRKRLKKSEF
jgi:hypothetical protein